MPKSTDFEDLIRSQALYPLSYGGMCDDIIPQGFYRQFQALFRYFPEDGLNDLMS
jgi:hypothetical protein